MLCSFSFVRIKSKLQCFCIFSRRKSDYSLRWIIFLFFGFWTRFRFNTHFSLVRRGERHLEDLEEEKERIKRMQKESMWPENERESGGKTKAGRTSTDIYRRRQSLVSVTPRGSEAHLSVFSNQHCGSNLLSFARSFPPSLPLWDWVTVCLQACAAASSVPALHTDCVYWVNMLCSTAYALVLLSLWEYEVGFYPDGHHLISQPRI